MNRVKCGSWIYVRTAASCSATNLSNSVFCAERIFSKSPAKGALPGGRIYKNREVESEGRRKKKRGDKKKQGDEEEEEKMRNRGWVDCEGKKKRRRNMTGKSTVGHQTAFKTLHVNPFASLNIIASHYNTLHHTAFLSHSLLSVFNCL